MVVCGDSAGGNLALLISIYSKIKIIPKIHGQILIYPWVDFTMSRPSINIELNGILVNKKTLLYFADHYLKNENEITDWRVSPILFPDLSNLRPTYIFGAGIDPLVDEGEALSRRLRSFNNEVHYKLYPGKMHAFVSNIVSLNHSCNFYTNKYFFALHEPFKRVKRKTFFFGLLGFPWVRVASRGSPGPKKVKNNDF